ncbi:hypothetical protein HU200_019081 [Digitaria exilis]|uniref:Uncharacterized protein n=1 Tax=Digitaria exilis TaxID=1010633 RepID=A0A835F437_9POAL|nr:hypothetical protein HU200_019081 [Digitaria exilis]CAB3460790.1 unnamed protein product [Digitaria exilis]
MAAAVVQQELLPFQAAPRQVHLREGPSRFIALLGASLVVFSVAVEPPVHAWFGLVGFLLWLMWMARLLLFGQIGRLFPAYTAALAAATAKLAVQKVKRLFFGPQEPAPAPA